MGGEAVIERDEHGGLAGRIITPGLKLDYTKAEERFFLGARFYLFIFKLLQIIRNWYFIFIYRL